MAAPEIRDVISASEAGERIARVRAHVEQAWDDLIALYAGRAWHALGYESWDALCDGEFDGARIALPRESRREAVEQMRGAGMSTRAIGSAIGVAEATVRRDLDATATNDAVARPSTVTSLDGRTRPATRPTPAPSHDREWAVSRFPVLDVPNAPDDKVVMVAEQVLTHPEHRQAHRAENGAKWLAALDKPRTPVVDHSAAHAAMGEIGDVVITLNHYSDAVVTAWLDSDDLTRRTWLGSVIALRDALDSIAGRIAETPTLRSVR